MSKIKEYINSIRDAKINKGFYKKIFIIAIVLTMLMFWYDQAVYYLIGYDYPEENSNEYYEEEFGWDESCNVVGIELYGDLHTVGEVDEDGYEIKGQSSSEDIVYYIEEAEYDDNIEAIILEIDSLGGDAVAAEEVANALKRAEKPTVALIRGYGDSAAYWAATGADMIFASANSDIGSIGVTMSYLDYSKQNQMEGLTYNQLSSGEFKDIGDFDKSLTAREKELLMRDVNIMNENFIKAVAENRGLSISEVRLLADGSSMLGEMALEKGLIDQIGDLYDVEMYLGNIIDDWVNICW